MLKFPSNFGIWLIVWHHLLLRIATQAPGDEDDICTSHSVFVIPHVYPSNMKVLMDSHNYENLLPPIGIPDGDSVWQEVGVDTDQQIQSWFQIPSAPCRHVLSSCVFDRTSGIVTQHMSRTIQDSIKLSQVSVLVEFQLDQCGPNCQASFTLSIWETSRINRIAARNVSLYTSIQTIVPNSFDSFSNVSIPVKFATNETGFYLALTNNNTCIRISRVMVFYTVCPSTILSLVEYPQTISPTLVHQTVMVKGQCVKGASRRNSGTSFLHCSQRGHWTSSQNETGCQCDQGFIKHSNGSGCLGCPAGQYLASNVSLHCLDCPLNTKLDESAVTMCQCLSGYFRAPHESIHASCTPPPNKCTNLEVVSLTETTLTVQWSKPNNTGRNDFYYKIFYKDLHQPGDFVTVTDRYVNTSQRVIFEITDLNPSQTYQVRVSPHSNVSDQDFANEHLRWCEVQASTLQTGVPGECRNLAVTSTSDRDVIIQWSRPKIVGERYFYYKILYSDLNSPGQFITHNTSVVDLNSVVTYQVTGLIPFQMYRLRVTTHNSISDMNSDLYTPKYCEVTASTRQRVPDQVSKVRAFCSVIVWEEPTLTRGDILHYQLLIQPQRRTFIVTSPFYITSEEDRTPSTTVQIQAVNGAGLGPYNNPTSIGCQDASTSCPSTATPNPPLPSTLTPSPNTATPNPPSPNTATPNPRSPTTATPNPPSPITANYFRFELKGKTYLNDTVVIMEDIGEGLDALLCFSTYDSCCYTGEFFYPNGSEILIGSHGFDLYRNRGRGLGFIRLNRRRNVTSPEGRYRCVVPVGNGKNESLTINIVSLRRPDPPSPPVATPCPPCASCPPATSNECPTCPPAAPCPHTSSPITTSVPSQATPTTLPVNSTPTPETTIPLEQTTAPVVTTDPPPVLYFELKGQVYQNNSVIRVEEIGEHEDALRCVSEDNPLCCSRTGDFYYPNGTRIPGERENHSFWRNRGKEVNQPYVRLHRRPNRSLVSGVFRCDIPFTDLPRQRLYVTVI